MHSSQIKKIWNSVEDRTSWLAKYSEKCVQIACWSLVVILARFSSHTPNVGEVSCGQKKKKKKKEKKQKKKLTMLYYFRHMKFLLQIKTFKKYKWCNQTKLLIKTWFIFPC